MVSVFCISWGPYALLSIIGILRHSEVKRIAYTHHFNTLHFDGFLGRSPLSHRVSSTTRKELNYLESFDLYLYE